MALELIQELTLGGGFNPKNISHWIISLGVNIKYAKVEYPSWLSSAYLSLNLEHSSYFSKKRIDNSKVIQFKSSKNTLSWVLDDKSL